jgi:chromosome segregation ATPase
MSREEIIKAQVDIERAELKAAHEDELNRLDEIIYQSNANNDVLVKEIAEIEKEKQEAMNTIFELKQEIEIVKEKAAEELELAEKRFAESLDQVKTEVKEGKDSEIQEYKIKLIELEKVSEEYQKNISKLTEQKEKSEECIAEIKNSLESLEKEKYEFLSKID